MLKKTVLIFAIFLLLLPQLLSLHLFKTELEKGLGFILKGKVSFDQGSLSWIQGAKFKNLSFEKNGLKTTIDFLIIQTPLYLWPLTPKEHFSLSFEAFNLSFNNEPLLTKGRGVFSQGKFEGEASPILLDKKEDTPPFAFKAFLKEGIFFLEKPLHVHFILTPSFAKQFLPSALFLTAPATFNLKVEQFSFPFSKTEKNSQKEKQASLKAFLDIPKLHLMGPADFGSLYIDQGESLFYLSEENQILYQGFFEGNHNSLPFKSTFNGLLSQKGELLSSNFEWNKASVRALAHFFNLQGTLEQLLGNTAKIALKTEGNQATLNLETPNLKAEPLVFSFFPTFSLKEKATLSLKIKQFTFKDFPAHIKDLPLSLSLETLNWPKLNIKGALKIEKGGTFHLPVVGNFNFDQQFFHFDFKNESKNKDLLVFETALFQGRAQRTQDSPWSFEVKGEGLSFQGKFQDPLKFELSFKDFQTKSLKPFLKTNERLLNTLEAFSGPVIQGKCLGHLHDLSGTWKIYLEGDLGTLTASGDIANGIVLLDSPLKLKTTISDQLKKSVFAEIIPFLTEVKKGEQPLFLTIQPKGFAFSLLPFDLSLATIKTGEIQLGKFLLTPSETLGALLSFFNPSTQLKEIPLWLTPLYFSLKNQVVTVQRVDALVAHEYPMAIWGKAHLSSEKIDFMIALTGKTVQSILNTKSEKTDLKLLIPFKGKGGKASLDKKSLALQIASLLSKESESTKGKLTGAILDIVGGGLKKTEIPPPTTSPLPWENNKDPKKEKKKTD